MAAALHSVPKLLTFFNVFSCVATGWTHRTICKYNMYLQICKYKPRQGLSSLTLQINEATVLVLIRKFGL